MYSDTLRQLDARLLQSGEGEVLRTRLFPGIELSQTRLFSERLEVEHAALSHILEVNYCRRGRIGWNMKNGTSVYLGEGDLDIHTMDCCAVSSMRLPLGFYEGITLTLDLDLLEREPPALLREAGIDCRALLRKLCPDGNPLTLPANEHTAHIFAPLETVPEALRLPYYKLKALELLLFLQGLTPEREKQLSRYHASQVEAVERIHDLLTEDLGRRYTIEELARRFLLNTATLKAVFKAVYNQPIGSYMREYRIRRAMELLCQTDLSIAEIAALVGYESQGKFTDAFKRVAQMPPSEYRRRHRASH